MQCESISNISFSNASKAAIKDIRRRNQMAKVLSKMLPTGMMVNIFLGNGVLKSSYNITQTDFEALAKAMKSVPAIHRKVVKDIAMMQALSHSGRESKFWKGIANGCGM
jgi:hypothetical protein